MGKVIVLGSVRNDEVEQAAKTVCKPELAAPGGGGSIGETCSAASWEAGTQEK